MATLARHFNPAGACRAATQRIATSAAAATTRPLHGGLFPRPRRQPARPTPLPIHPASSPQPAAASAALFSHTAAPGAAAARRGRVGHNNEPVPDQAPETDFSRMDMLGSVPVPATSVDICMWDGFALNSGTKILDGSGALLVAGEAFAWRPWGARKRLLNARGQWEVDPAALGILSLVWPRPGAFLSLSLSLSPSVPLLSFFVGKVLRATCFFLPCHTGI